MEQAHCTRGVVKRCRDASSIGERFNFWFTPHESKIRSTHIKKSLINLLQNIHDFILAPIIFTNSLRYYLPERASTLHSPGRSRFVIKKASGTVWSRTIALWSLWSAVGVLCIRERPNFWFQTPSLTQKEKYLCNIVQHPSQKFFLNQNVIWRTKRIGNDSKHLAKIFRWYVSCSGRFVYAPITKVHHTFNIEHFEPLLLTHLEASLAMIK